MKKAIIICGPTASGKTDFAHRLAIQKNGEVINADSMQLYRQLPIITASPEKHLKDELPYHLYNFQDIDQELSAGKYVNIASKTIEDTEKRHKIPIIVGGSGMYISMLVNGYSQIPEIDPKIRETARKLHKKIGTQQFFYALEKLDSQVTKILSINDTQRLIRAYEVTLQTGKSILYYQEQVNIRPLDNFEFYMILLLPEREFLYDTCNNRLKLLFESGAIEEVEKAYRDFGDIKTTAMKALGVSEIITYLKGEISLNDAINLASAKTRQYAKRQTTWFKNQLNYNKIVHFNSRKQYQEFTDAILQQKFEL